MRSFGFCLLVAVTVAILVYLVMALGVWTVIHTWSPGAARLYGYALFTLPGVAGGLAGWYVRRRRS